MALVGELERIAGIAATHARDGDVVAAVIPTEPAPSRRIYLCAFDDADGYRSWLAVDADGRAVTSRRELRASISIAALCEVASDAAGGGDLDALISRLEELRSAEETAGLRVTEEAARTLREIVAEPPQLASPARLDEIGAATRGLERELDPMAASPFAAAMRASEAAVLELEREIEAGYRVPLE